MVTHYDLTAEQAAALATVLNYLVPGCVDHTVSRDGCGMVQVTVRSARGDETHRICNARDVYALMDGLSRGSIY